MVMMLVQHIANKFDASLMMICHISMFSWYYPDRNQCVPNLRVFGCNCPLIFSNIFSSSGKCVVCPLKSAIPLNTIRCCLVVNVVPLHLRTPQQFVGAYLKMNRLSSKPLPPWHECLPQKHQDMLLLGNPLHQSKTTQ